MISKGKRRYLVRAYRGLLQFRKFRELFGQPILTHAELSEVNARHTAAIQQLNANGQKLLESLGVPESYMIVTLPVRRQRMIEIDKSTGLPRGELPMVTLFTEKGPTDGACI